MSPGVPSPRIPIDRHLKHTCRWNCKLMQSSGEQFEAVNEMKY